MGNYKYLCQIFNIYVLRYDTISFFLSFSQHSELNNIIEKHNVVFTDDGNTGLIGQVVVARQKSNIKR